MISDFKVDKKKLDIIRKELAKKIGISWVDISFKPRKKLKNLKATIFNFDLKYGSRVIYGDESIVDDIPFFSPKEISFFDIRILFFTRMFTLIGCCDNRAFIDGISDQNSAMFFRSQLAKAVLATVDAILISFKSYNSSYIKRIEMVHELEEYKRYKDLFDWSLKQKLKPSKDMLNSLEVKDIYKQVINLFMSVFVEKLSVYYSVDNADYFKIIKKYRKENQILLRRLLYWSKGSDYMSNVLYSDSIQLAYIFSSPYLDSNKDTTSHLIKELNLSDEYDIEDQEKARVIACNLRLSL